MISFVSKPVDFQLLCDNCLLKFDSKEMPSRRSATRQPNQARRDYTYEFIAQAMTTEDILELDRELESLGCIDIGHSQLQTRQETTSSVNDQSNSSHQAEVSSTTLCPSTKIKRWGENEGQKDRQTDDDSSIVEVSRRTVESSNPSELSCAHYSDKGVHSTSSDETEQSSDQESIKEEACDEYMPSGSIPEKGTELVSGDNDDVNLDVSQQGQSRLRSTRIRRQTERYGNPLSS